MISFPVEADVFRLDFHLMMCFFLLSFRILIFITESKYITCAKWVKTKMKADVS